jgi:hypothetical protein
LKEKLIQHIRLGLEEKLQRAKANFESVRESLDSEGKSTAGDKHETGRAMVQMELEQAGKIIRESEEMTANFNKLNFSPGQTASAGSLVHTDKGIFFLGVPLGKISFEDQTVFCVGGLAPLFQVFIGKKEGEELSFGQQRYLVQKIE